MAGTGTNIKATLNCGAGRKRIAIEINQVMYEMARAHIAAPFLEISIDQVVEY